MAPEPNTPLVLAFDFVLGAFYSLLVLGGFGWRAAGVYARLIQWGFRLMMVTMPLRLVASAVDGPSLDRPKMSAVLAGATVSGAVTFWLIRRARPRGGEFRPGLRWWHPLDYVYGVVLYIALIVGIAEAAAEMSPSEYGGVVGLHVAVFLVSQIAVQFLFVFFSRAMRDDYMVSRGWHHVLVGSALVAAVIADVVVGFSPAGPLFSILMLWATWRYTQERPASTLKTLGFLRTSRAARRVAV